jgi:hypothetical protein
MKNKYWFSIILMFVILNLFAQDESGICEVIITPTGIIENEHDTLYDIRCNLLKQNDFSVEKIHIKIRHIELDTMLVDKFILINQPNDSLPQGLSIESDDEKFYLTLGRFCIPYYELEIRWVDSTLIESDSIQISYIINQ